MLEIQPGFELYLFYTFFHFQLKKWKPIRGHTEDRDLQSHRTEIFQRIYLQSQNPGFGIGVSLECKKGE